MSAIEKYKVGMVVYGKVTGVKPYGAFVGFEDGVTGLVHISEISNKFVKDITTFLEVGDYCMLKVIDIDQENAQLRLSYKALVDNKVEEKIKKSKYGQKQELRKLRANLTDFDRFKVMRLRQKRAVLRHVATKGVAKKGGDKPSGAAKAQKPKKGGKK